MSYTDRTTNIGRGFGCAAMLMIVAIPPLPLLLVWAWVGAHCRPVPQCQRTYELHIGVIFALIVAVAILVGAGISKCVNRLAAKRDDGGYSMIFLLLSGCLTATATALTLFGAYMLIG